jgi:hypothetical protein
MKEFREKLSAYLISCNFRWTKIYSHRGPKVCKIKYWGLWHPRPGQCGNPTLTGTKVKLRGITGPEFDFVKDIEIMGMDVTRSSACYRRIAPSIVFYIDQDKIPEVRKPLFYVVTYRGGKYLNSIHETKGCTFSVLKNARKYKTRHAAWKAYWKLRNALIVVHGKEYTDHQLLLLTMRDNKDGSYTVVSTVPDNNPLKKRI